MKSAHMFFFLGCVVKYIIANVFALNDSETDGSERDPGKSIRDFERICKRLGVCQHTFERRATENYLTDPAVSKVLGGEFHALGAHDFPPAGWSKAQGWKIAREMPLEDIQQNDLGWFLTSVVEAEMRA